MILLVEDNLINQEVALANLEILGYRADVAENGALAVEAVKQNHYDLILMDIRMPVMDGIEASKEIKKYETENSLPHVPIIAISAELSSETRKRCSEAKIDDCLPKPFNSDELADKISCWLRDDSAAKEPAAKNDSSHVSPNPQQSIDTDKILDIAIIKQLQELHSKTGRNVLNNVIDSYLESVLNDSYRMRQSLINNDLDDIAKIAHSLKSASGMLGVSAIYNTVIKLEEEALNGNADKISALIDEITNAFPLVGDALLKLAAERNAPDTSSVHAVGDEQKLLIVEDNHVTLETIVTSMQILGYSVDSASNGEQALQLLDKNEYDLLITDLQMPVMDGYALCEAVRITKNAATLPIIVISGTSDEVHIQRAYEMGISNFFVKPVNYLNLAYCVLFTLQNAKSTRELWRNQKFIESVEETAKVSHWYWLINEKKIEHSDYLKKYFKLSLSNDNDLREYIQQMGGEHMWSIVNKCLDTKKEAQWEQTILTDNENSITFILHRFKYVKSSNGSILIGTVQDITSIRNAELRIFELAYYDSLTGLSTRLNFNTQLEKQIAIAERRKEKISLLYLDLDNFKNINNSCGREAGDELLVTIANRIKAQLRETDVACRPGGDEFCIMLNEVRDEVSAAEFTCNLQQVLAEPVKIAGKEIMLAASIGIAMYPNDGTDANTLTKAADTALHAAKHAEKNQYAFFEPAMTEAAQKRLTLEQGLRTAIKENQFELYYQPKISLATGKMVGVEALIRWNHPENGLYMPNTFIPIAENMGIISEIGKWVVSTACNQIKTWSNAGLKDMPVAVNISPLHFAEDDFVDDVSNIVSEKNINPSLIEIEITESSSRDQKVFTQNCHQLRERGFTVAIDDFGTGYSSLSMLKGASIDVLKIDREFIRHLPKDTESSVLIGTILGMSKALGLKVVAEGIEDETQLQVLLAMGCHILQGNYFSKAVPAVNIASLQKVDFRKLKQNTAA